MGAFFFACGAQKSIKDIISKFPDGLDILGYLDDNNLIVKRSMAADVYNKLVSKFKSIGLEIDHDKTVIFGSPQSLTFLKNEKKSLSDIPNMSSTSLSVLGVPLGLESEVKLELKNSITKFSRVIPLVTQLSPKIAFFLLKFCINTRPTYILRTSGPWVSQESIKLFDSYIDKAIQHLTSTNVGHRIIKNLNDLDSIPDLSDVSKIVRSLPIREGGAGIRRGLDISEAAYTSSFLSSFQFISCEPKLTNFVESLFSTATPFTNKLVALIQPLELKYKSDEVNNIETLSLYLHDTSSKTPNQKSLTMKIDERLVKAINQLLIEKDLPTSMAWFLSNKPMETAFWLLFPFQDQTSIQLTDDEFIEVFRLRLLIPIDKFDDNHCRECACGRVLFPGKDDHHFMICTAVGGPCSDRTTRHNRIRTQLYYLVRKFYENEGAAYEEQFINDPLVAGGTRRKSDVAVYGVGDANSIHYDVSVTCPSSLRVCQDLQSHVKQFAAAISREKGKSSDYKKSYGEVFVANQLIPVVLETSGAFGPSLQLIMKKFKRMAKDAATVAEQRRLAYAIKWFYKISVILCCKFTAKLAKFNRSHRRRLVPIGDQEFTQEPIPADSFDDTTYAPIFPPIHAED